MINPDSIHAVSLKRQPTSSHQQRQPAEDQVQYFKKLLSGARKKKSNVSSDFLVLLMLPRSWFTILASQLARANSMSSGQKNRGGIDTTLQKLINSAFAPACLVVLKQKPDSMQYRVASAGDLLGAEMVVTALHGQDEKKRFQIAFKANSATQLDQLRSIHNALKQSLPADYELADLTD